MIYFDFVLVKGTKEKGYIVPSEYDEIPGQLTVQIDFEVKVFNVEELEPDGYTQSIQYHHMHRYY